MPCVTVFVLQRVVQCIAVVCSCVQSPPFCCGMQSVGTHCTAHYNTHYNRHCAIVHTTHCTTHCTIQKRGKALGLRLLLLKSWARNCSGLAGFGQIRVTRASTDRTLDAQHCNTLTHIGKTTFAGDRLSRGLFRFWPLFPPRGLFRFWPLVPPKPVRSTAAKSYKRA